MDSIPGIARRCTGRGRTESRADRSRQGEVLVIWVMTGVLTGIVGGLFGIGGAAVLVPILVLAFGFSQQQAQGTSLMVLLPPIGILAALQYYRAGFVDVRVALLIAAGFLVGAFGGATVAVRVPSVLLQRGFGVLLVALGLQMVFRR